MIHFSWQLKKGKRKESHGFKKEEIISTLSLMNVWSFFNVVINQGIVPGNTVIF